MWKLFKADCDAKHAGSGHTGACGMAAFGTRFSAFGISAAEFIRGWHGKTMHAIIQARDLARIYQIGDLAVEALRGVSFDIQPRE